MDNKMTAEQAMEWAGAQALSCEPEIHQALAVFSADCTEANAVCVIQAVAAHIVSQALSAPRVPNIEHPHAVAASIKMLRSKFQGARCDSDGVSGCVHCNVMFLCAQVEKLLAASPEPVAPQPEGQITNQGAVYSQAEAWQSVVEALDALQPGWILQVGKTATESAVELIRDWQAEAAQYHVVMAEYTTDIYSAAKSWPEDIRAKLSIHDLRRMGGWRAPVSQDQQLIADLRAEVEALREALRPLALLDLRGDNMLSRPDDQPVYARDNTVITVGDVRRAAARLREGREEQLTARQRDRKE